jgi:hypothetical protein
MLAGCIAPGERKRLSAMLGERDIHQFHRGEPRVANRRRSSNRPQAQHKKSKMSPHDKRERFERRSAAGKTTTIAKVPLTGAISTAT